MRPSLEISQEMIDNALKMVPSLTVNRTKASRYDTLYGVLGEYCFAQWLFGDWRPHSLLDTKGKIDFLGRVEVKTSAFPFSERLNLLVREDYATKRKPEFYVQTIIDIPNSRQEGVKEGMKCILAGYATANEIEDAPLKDFGSKFGGAGGYRCRYLSISTLKSVEELRSVIT